MDMKGEKEKGLTGPVDLKISSPNLETFLEIFLAVEASNKETDQTCAWTYVSHSMKPLLAPKKK